MKKEFMEGNENQVTESPREGKHRLRWLHAIKGVFYGIGTIIRPETDFLYHHKRKKPDGVERETIIRWTTK